MAEKKKRDAVLSSIEASLQFGLEARKSWEEDYKYARELAYKKHDRTFYGASDDGLDKSPALWARTTDPVVHEYLKHYLPHLLFRAPHRNVVAGGTADPFVASTTEQYLKHTADEYDLKNEARRALVQGLLGGECGMWTWPDKRMGIVRSEYVNMLDIIKDADVADPKACRWLARKIVAPVWAVRKKFSKPDLKANYSLDIGSLTSIRGGERYNVSDWGTNDMVVYYEIWSKMDFALSRHAGGEFDASKADEYCWMVHAPGSSELLDYEKGWPYDVYQADDCWPLSTWGHYYDPESVWAANPIRCIFGYQKFLNWALSFILMRLRTTSIQKLFLKSGDLSKVAMKALQSNDDLAIVELNQTAPGAISDIMDILKWPDVQSDFFRALNHVYERIRELLGLRGILMGETGTAQRSAMEADIKDRNARVPIESMADGVEDWQSEVGRKEMLLALRYVPTQTVKDDDGLLRGIEMFGETAQVAWQGRPKNPDEIANQYSVRVVAGAGRKKDQASEITDADNSFAMLSNALQLAGDVVDPISRLKEINKALMRAGVARGYDAAQIHQLAPNPMITSPQPMGEEQEAEAEESAPQKPVGMQNGQPVYGKD